MCTQLNNAMDECIKSLLETLHYTSNVKEGNIYNYIYTYCIQLYRIVYYWSSIISMNACL